MRNIQEPAPRYYYREHRMVYLAVLFIAGLICLMPVLEQSPSVMEEDIGKTRTVYGIVQESREGNSYLWLRLDDVQEVVYVALPHAGGDDTGTKWYPAGSKLKVVGSLAKPQGRRNPGGFDEARWLLSKKAKIKLHAEEIQVIRNPQGIWKLSWLVQCQIKQTAERFLTEEQNHLAMALLLGEKQKLDQSFYRMTQRMGIAHIFAVSGLHVGFAGAMFLFLFRIVHRERGRVSFFVLAAGLGFYCMLSGLAPSALRAAFMILLAALAMRLLRPPAPVDFLALTAVLLLFDNPFLLYQAGFQLSFGVTLCLLLFIQPVQKRLWFIKWRWLRDSIAVSLTASLGSIPLTAWHFYTVSLLAPLYNLLFVPIVSILVPLLLIAFFGSLLFPAVGKILFQVAKILLDLLYHAPVFLSELIGDGQFCTGRPGWLAVILYMLFLNFFWHGLNYGQQAENMLYKIKRETKTETQKGIKKYIQKASAVCFFMAVFCIVFSTNINGDNELLYLDTGQGGCALLRTGAGETIVFDGGAQERELASVLAWYGIQEIKAVIVSHGDKDHISGILQMLEMVPAEYLCMEKTQSQREDVIPVLLAAEAGGTKIKPVEKEARLALAEGEILLKAIDDGGTETNSRELASVLYLAQQVAVFPGDLGIAGIRKLIDGQKQITIWTVPHHGSRFSADEEIYMRLEEKGARLAVVSAGQNNRYGHPHQEVLEYLNASHIAVHRTDLEGAVCLNLNEGKKRRIETSKSIYGDNL